jgi:dTDP-4-dehydrorhamnose reductase
MLLPASCQLAIFRHLSRTDNRCFDVWHMDKSNSPVAQQECCGGNRGNVMKIVLLGGSGYVGLAFQRALIENRMDFAALCRKQVDYTCYRTLVEYLRRNGPVFLINAAGFTGKPNVDACETSRTETLQGNTLLPMMISHACDATNTPWGHVSSGCVYSGAIIDDGNSRRIETDLTTPGMQSLLESNPEHIRGFSETDEPNFSFRHPPCSFYSGTKALAEESLASDPRAYVWRLRIPFNSTDNHRNYLSKLQRYPKVYDNVNSVSHLNDFVHACLRLWELRAPFGTYNVTNPGFVTSRQVVELIQAILKPSRSFDFWTNDSEFYQEAAGTPRSNCVLDSSKLVASGVTMRTAEEALSESLLRWQPASDRSLHNEDSVRRVA